LSLDDLSCALTTCSRRSEGLEEERSMGLKPRGGEVLFANIMVTVYIVCKNGADPDWFDATISEGFPTC